MLSKHIADKIIDKFGNSPLYKSESYTEDDALIYQKGVKNYPSPLRTNAIIDIERIMSIPFYNRYSDKTQVYSLKKNDDITHRALHVQLVSRTARDIGRALGLNIDLIEAIALGHDLGHTPFGHLGEAILDNIYYKHVKRHFMHNVQSVRVLYKICPMGFSLQTLDGILCHNGEVVQGKLDPKNSKTIKSFAKLDEVLENAEINGDEYIKKFTPSTLEGAVVRFSDIIAYLGKDRNDAYRMQNKFVPTIFKDKILNNANTIQLLTEDIVEQSFEKPYIALSDDVCKFMKETKKENYSMIYASSDDEKQLGTSSEGTLYDLFSSLYDILLKDLQKENTKSPIYTHHIKYLISCQKPEKREEYEKNYIGDRSTINLNKVVCDYIASMTDDYFMEISSILCPRIPHLIYKGYFDKN